MYKYYLLLVILLSSYPWYFPKINFRICIFAIRNVKLH